MLLPATYFQENKNRGQDLFQQETIGVIVTLLEYFRNVYRTCIIIRTQNGTKYQLKRMRVYLNLETLLPSYFNGLYGTTMRSGDSDRTYLSNEVSCRR